MKVTTQEGWTGEVIETSEFLQSAMFQDVSSVYVAVRIDTNPNFGTASGKIVHYSPEAIKKSTP